MASIVINNTLFTGKFLLHKPHLTSTNLFARELLAKTKPIDGTVIITDDQTQGRGQGGHAWVTEAGKNLTFSIIYDTSFLLANQQFYMCMAVTKGILNAVRFLASQTDLAIKWSNDIICNDKKIGGILIENSIKGKHLKYSVIGIGLNINQTQFENLPYASSLTNETGQTFDLNMVLEEVCHHIETHFLKLKAGKFAIILEDYNQSLYKLNQPISYQKNEIQLNGTLKSVNEMGQLIVLEPNGESKYNYGEIRWIY